MKIITKLILRIMIFCIIIGGIVYYCNMKLNSITDNFRNSFAKSDYQFSYDSRGVKFLLFKNEIILHGVEIKHLSKNNIRIEEISMNINLFSLLFRGGAIDNVLLNGPSFNIYINDNNSQNIIQFFTANQISDFKGQIINGRVIFYGSDSIPIKEYNDIDGSINVQNNNIDTSFNIENFIADGRFERQSNSEYAINAKIHSDSDSLSYKSNIQFDEKKILSIDGNIKANGKQFVKIIQLFCINCSCQRANNDGKPFDLQMKINYSGDTFKLENIKFKSEENNLEGQIVYNIPSRKLNLEINAEELKILNELKEFNIFAIKNQVINEEANIFELLSNYFTILNNYDFQLNLKIKKLNFGDYFINDIESLIISNNKKIEIQKLFGKLNDKYNINSIGNIVTNNFRNQLQMQTSIYFNSKNNGVSFNLLVMPGAIFIKNIYVKDNNFMMGGDLFLRRNQEENDLCGTMQFFNLDLNLLIDKFNSFTKNKDNDKNSLLNSLLVILNKMKTNSDLKLIFNNSRLNNNIVKNLQNTIKIDEKRILINSIVNDEKIANLASRIELFWDQLKPNINIDIAGNYLNLKNLLNILNISDNYKDFFLQNEADFKKNNDKNIWRDYPISFQKIADINLFFRSELSNIIYNNIKIKESSIEAISNDNRLKLTKFSNRIGDGSIDIAGNLDIKDQTLGMILIINNLNFNNLLQENKEKPIVLSASGKLSTNGDSVFSMLNNLNSNFNYLLYNIKINNLDVNLFANNINLIRDYSSLVSLGERSVVSGSSILNNIKGSIDIKKGLLVNEFKFSSDRFTGNGIFHLLTVNMIFKGLTRIAFIPNKSKQTFYADIDWSGNLFNTNKSFNIEKLRQIVLNRQIQN